MQKAPDSHYKIFYIRQISHQPLDKFPIMQTSQTPTSGDKTTKSVTLHTDDQASCSSCFPFAITQVYLSSRIRAVRANRHGIEWHRRLRGNRAGVVWQCPDCVTSIGSSAGGRDSTYQHWLPYLDCNLWSDLFHAQISHEQQTVVSLVEAKQWCILSCPEIYALSTPGFNNVLWLNDKDHHQTQLYLLC
jgi:hypothetical protein